MSEPLLLRIAGLCLGITEVPGRGSNPVIMRWAKDIGAPAFVDDAVAWCAVTMNRWVMACLYPLSGAGYDLLRAKSFETWGQALAAPALGAVLVFSRPEGAHVGLYLGETTTHFRVRGGNQGDAVSDIWILKTRLTATRWPPGVTLPTTGPILLAANGEPASSNEA